MNVILNHRLPAIQISETEFKYLTGTELVGIIQDKNKELDALNEKIASLTKDYQDLREKLTAAESKVNTKKDKRDDDNAI